MPVTASEKSLGQAVPAVVRLSGKRSLRWNPRPRRRISALLLALLSHFVPSLLPVACALDLNALPTNGSIRVGAGNITQSGNQLTVQQGTPKLGIDWASFNIGANATVNFVQPSASAIALNRVTGNDASQIYGQLNANGQVFLVNPNGVLFAPGAKVDVGGLLASTLDLSQENFAGGNYRFSGNGGAISNQGGLRAAPGGYVGLFGGNVANQGQIDAPMGSVVLASGSAVTVAIDHAGLLSAVVTPATTAALVRNSGNVVADGGSVHLDAQAAQGIAESLVNNSGVIRANSIENRNGEIYLTGAQTVRNTGTLDVSATAQGHGGAIVVKADMQSGTAQVGGTLLARGGAQGGDGGSVETSGAHATMATGLVVDATAPKGKTGQWLVDPNDYVIAASGGDISGTTLGANLLTANITLSSDSGTVLTSAGHGDITVNDNVTWIGSNTLTLNAFRNINVNANISNNGGAQLMLHSDDTGTGTGTVVFGANGAIAMGSTGRADLGYNPSSYATPTDFSAHMTGSTNWTAWMLVNSVGQASGGTVGLQAISTNLAGNYALGKDIDASATLNWNGGGGFTPLGAYYTPFTGWFTGLGHTISGLVVNWPSQSYVGLFGVVNTPTSATYGAPVSSVNLSGGSIVGASNVGSLVGSLAGGSGVSGVSSSMTVTGTSSVGGLVGSNAGGVTNSSASGLVTGSSNIGGLVGFNAGLVATSYASGVVHGVSYSNALGGLVGYNNAGTVSGSYATGAVTGLSGTNNVGGLIGYSWSGVVSNSYASNAVSGPASNIGSIIGYSAYSTLTNVYSNIDHSSVNGVTVYDANAFDSAQVQEKLLNNGALNIGNYSSLHLNPTTGVYEIGSLQGMKDLLGFAGNTQYSFALTGPIDLSGLAGYYIPSFTARSFSGQGYAISNLSVQLPSTSNIGFIGSLGSGSTLSNLTLTNVNVSGASYVGGVVGVVQGQTGAQTSLSNISVSGSVTASNYYAGGMVGYLTGSAGINNASSSVNVVSSSGYVGGLVGYMVSGTVSQAAATGTATGTSNVGGLVGSVGGGGANINNAYATGLVTGTGNYLGGLVGYEYNSTLSNVYATGAVNGGANGNVVGGLVGYLLYGTLSSAYSTGAVTGATSLGPLIGTSAGATIASVMYNIDTSKVNSVPIYGTYGLDTTQFQDMLTNGSLSISRYATTLPYDSVSGTYVISSNQGLRDLLGFANNSGLKFSLGIDLDLSAGATSGGVTYNTSGYSIPSFTAAMLDGVGHTISNLTLNSASNLAQSTSQGFIATLGGSSVVRNLNLANVNVTGTGSVGGLVGTVNSPSLASVLISNVSVSGTVTGPNSNYVGGVVGNLSYNAGADQMVSSVNVSGNQYVGGAVGYNNNGAISNSSATGAISSAYYYAGGLIGYNGGGTVSNSHATGNVSGISGARYLGGLIGYNSGNVSNSYATGSVGPIAIAGTPVTYAVNLSYMGGLMGYSGGTLTNVYATGAVNGGPAGAPTGTYVGGLVGSNSGQVRNSYASGAVTGLNNTAALFGSNSVTTLSNLAYNIDTSSVNGVSTVGPFGIYGTQFQTWVANGMVLNIADYASSSLPYNSATGTYDISTVQGMKDLLGFAALSTASFRLNIASLDLSSLPGYYIPIFSAHSFDGNSNTITGLNVNQPAVNNVGFIGNLGAGSTLTRLNLSNVSVIGGNNVGGAVGYMTAPNSAATMVSNVTVSNGGSVSGTGQYVGGLVGNNTGSGAIVASGAGASVTGVGYVGGLVGGNSNGALTNSFSSGTVTDTAGNNVSRSYFGGLAGYNGSGALTGDYSSAAVSVGASTSTGVYVYQVGGLVGQNNGLTSNSYATGAVHAGTSTGSSATYVGGLIGLNYGAITGSYANGNVTLGSSGGYVGGLIGNNGNSVDTSHATGAVLGYGSVGNMGGLIGYNSALLSNVYATGSVTIQASTSSTVSAGSYVGGLVGQNSGGVTNAYASGAVIGALNTAALFGANSTTSISNVYYDIDTSTINGQSLVGPYGIYDTQFQVWANHNYTLNIADYAATLPNVAGVYQIGDVQGMKDLLGFANVAGYSFALTRSFSLSSVPGYYIPVFAGHQFNGNNFALSGLVVNLPSTNNVGFIGTLSAASTLTNLTLTNVSVTGAANVGGAVGNVLSPGSATTMLSNVNVSGTVLGTGNYVGGVVGQITSYGGLNNVSSSASVQGMSNVGGVAGAVNYASVQNSFATGDVNAFAGGSSVGGLVGSSSSTTFTNDYATGNVTVMYSVNVSSNGVGGLIGAVNSGAISSAYATGSVDAGANGSSVGGLVGSAQYTPISHAYALGSVTGNYYVGGLLGNSGSAVSGSFATGVVRGVNYVGGLVGVQGSATVSNSYATGTVGQGSNGYVGGLFGQVTYSTLTNSYSSGLVGPGANRGGLAAYGYGNTVSGVYWDTSTSGISTSAVGTGMATAQMQAQATFSGWDFANTWKIYQGTSYPILQSYLRPLTISAGTYSKTYDSNPYATSVTGVTYSDPSAVSQLQGALVVGTTAQTAVNAGTYAITPSGLWSNTQFGYNITYVPGSLTITPLTVTVSGLTAADKVYNGNLYASINGGSFDNTNVLPGDLGAVSVIGMQGLFADKNAGTNKTVSVPIGTALGGTAGMNYVVSNASTTTASITPKSLTVSAVLAGNKVYDGTVTASLSGGTLVGVVPNDVVSLTGLTGNFSDKNAGTAKTVTLSGGVLTGTDYANYVINGSLSATATANITALAITSSGITGVSKVYDQGVNASLNTSNAVLNGVLSGDSVSLDVANLSGTFANKNVGTGKTVTLSGLALTGTDFGNYSVTDASHVSANITPRAVSITGAVAYDRAYNGNLIAAITGAVANGVLTGDSINTSALVGQFDTKNVGTGKAVTIVAGTALAGTDGANYMVGSSNAMTASITPLQLNVTAVTVSSKVYDGTTTANVTGGQLLGVLGTDSVTLTSVTGQFANKNAGLAKTVNFSGGALVGPDAGNYQLNGAIPVTAQADIAAQAVVVSGITAQDKVYDRSTSATLNSSGLVISGLVLGDAVTVSTRSLAGTFANKNVGNGKAVTITGLALGGADAGNYTVSDPVGATASITPAPVTLSGYSAASKTYDGNRTAVVSGSGAQGLINGDTVISTTVAGLFDSKSAGFGKTVTVVGSALGGADGANYVVVSANPLTADILPRVLSTSAITALDKVYDGTTIATLIGGSLSNVVYGDNVSLTAMSGSFADKNVAQGKTVTISGGALVGSDSSNYVLPGVLSGTTQANITTRVLNTTGITAQSKVYDQRTTASINTSAVALSGVLGGDSVTLDTNAALGNFADKNVGAGKRVTITGMVMAGSDAANYQLVDASNATASITPLGVSLSGYSVASKVYDGTRVATVSGGVVAGVLNGDTVAPTIAGLFDSKNVGYGKAVSVIGLGLGGTDGGNYVISAANGLSADITPKTLNVSTITVNNKVYDGTLLGAISGGLLSGVVGSDNVALTAVSALFADKNVANGKTVALSGGALRGADAGNYVLSAPVASSATADITPLAITTSGITAADKAYDGTRIASITTSNAALHGVLGADNVTLNLRGASGTFADKNVGSAKAVTVSGLTLSGTDAQNYTVSDASYATASITLRGVTLSGYTANGKVYDGSVTATATGGSAIGVLQGDTVNTTTITGTFADKNVGIAKTVTVVGSTLGGTDGANYVVTSANPLAATITAKSLTISAISIADKVYDGGVSAGLSGGVLSGVVQGDSVSLSALTATFADKNVGNGKAVTISGGSLGGADVGNYVLLGSLPSSATANITPLAITASGITGVDKVYDRSTSDTLLTSGAVLSGVLSGDSVTLNLNGVQGNFANKNVGAGKSVAITGLRLNGADAGNYAVSDPVGTTASITALGVTITGASAANKVYDGTLAAAISGAVVSGVLSGDVVNAATLSGVFSDKNVGLGKAVSLNGLALLGADGGNYVITGANAVSASISPRALLVSAVVASNKVYDGTRSATLTGGDLTGVLVGDTVSLTPLGGSFADKNVGNYKTVTLTGGALTGADAGNYQLSNSIPGSTTASITPLTLTLGGVTAQDKVYNQFRDATLNTTQIALQGVIGGDSVTLNAASAVGSFADKNVGSAKTVYISGLLLGGADASNYVVSNLSGASASVTAKAVTLTGYSAADKTYDGTNLATVTGGVAQGVYNGDLVTTSVLSGVFDSKNVGINKTVTINGVTLGGADGANYIIGGAAPVYASVVPKMLSVGSLTASDKVYDGSVVAAISVGSLVGVISNDSVALSGVNAVFADKNVGVAKTVTLSGGSLSGADAGNYLLSGAVPGTTTATITPRALTATGLLVADKGYDRSTSASVDSSLALLHGAVSGDSVALDLNNVLGSFADKNAGTAKAVTITGLLLNGIDAGNYTVSDASGATASIMPKSVTLSGVVAQSKVYDGTLAATINAANVNGVIAGDSVITTALTGQFDNKNVGSGKAVTFLNAVLGGTDGGNYSVSGSFSLTANITPRTLTVAGAMASDKVYDGTTAARFTGGVLSGVLNGDSVSMSGVTGSFADKNVGVAKAIYFSGGTLSGADAGNYLLSGANSGTTTASITPLMITASGITALDRAYDQTLAASLLTTGASLIGVLGSDSVALNFNHLQGSFADKNVGTGKTVSVQGLALTGADAGNYQVSAVGSLTASITPKVLSLSGVTAQDKVYDGTLVATLVGGNLSGVFAGDVVGINALGGFFDTKNVGVNKTVTLAQGSAVLTGADAHNYTVTSSGPMAAAVTPKTLTASGFSAADKVFDGTVATTAAATALTGLVVGDSVQVAQLSAVFADPNVVLDRLGQPVAQTVAISGGVLAGADAGNYQWTAANASSSATILPRMLTIATNNQVVPQDQLAGVAAGLTWTASGLVAGDQVAGITPPTIDPTWTYGRVQALTPTGFSLATGLASNYQIHYDSGYLIVLPSQSVATSDAGSNTNSNAANNATTDIFFIQGKAAEIKQAGLSFDRQLAALLGGGANRIPAPPGTHDNVSAVPSTSAEDVLRAAPAYLQEIKESTPSVIENLRSQPLLLWQEKLPELLFKLSDSGVDKQ